MKYFIDSEFMEDGKTIELLSLGIVCEDGRELYALNTQADYKRANAFVADSVIPHLFDVFPPATPPDVVTRCHGPKLLIAASVLQMIGDRNTPNFEKPEFWGYFADYDWVVFCQLFGTMMDLPKGWPMYCSDLKQLCKSLGDPELPPQGKSEHHALLDARWNKKAYEFLQTLKPT